MRVKLGDIAKINGQSVGNKFPYSKMKYLDTSSITKGIISNIQEFEYPSKDIPSRAQRVVKDKTIIYSTVRPRLCHFGILLNPDKNLIVSTGFVTIDVDEKIADPIYIYNILRDNKITDYLGNIADTAVSSYPSISSNDLRDLEIDILEDLEEQKQIGNFLLSIDKQINTNNEINAELESMAKTLYDYWFLQFEFPNEEGKPYKSSGGKMVWNEELKREIPEGWEVKKVGDCIEHINTGLNPRDNFILNDGEIKYITVKNLTTNGTLDFSGCDTISYETKQMINKRSLIDKGDILFASIAPLGRCYLIQETPKDWEINESVFSIRPNNNMVSSEYLYIYLMSDYFIKKAEHSSTGSIFAGIRISVLSDMLIIIPDTKTLSSFTTNISSMQALKNKCSNENLELVSLRDFLLPMLMNGQVTFKDEVKT